MPVTFAMYTSHPELLACQLARLESQVALADGPELNAVGIGSYAQEDVLLQRHAVDKVPGTLAAITPPEASEALLFQSQTLPPGTSLQDSAQPFRFRRWLFTFEGRLEAFESLRMALLESLPPYLQRQIGVGTQGEAAFSLFLKQLRDTGRTDDRRLDARRAAELLGKTARELQERSAAAGAALSSRMHLVASNAQLLLAARVGPSPLYYRLLEGADACVACGVNAKDSKLKPLARAHLISRAVCVASHLQPGARWLELPAGSVLGVGPDLVPFILNGEPTGA